MSIAPRLTPAGRFADPAAETAFLAAQFADATALGRLIVLGLLALDAAFVPIDLLNYGPNRDGAVAVGLRLVIVGWSAACWWGLRRVRSPAAGERLLGLWALLTAGLNLLTLTALPGNHLGAAAAVAVGAVLCYLLPLRLGWCLAVAAAASVLFLALLAANRRPEEPRHLLIDTTVGFVMANGVGLAAGRRLQADRRRRHAAGLALAEAAAELKTLRGLLPICSFCKQIRDPAGEWHRLEAFIQARTAARFTHGVCPGCLASEYGMTVDSVTDTPPLGPKA